MELKFPTQSRFHDKKTQSTQDMYCIVQWSARMPFSKITAPEAFQLLPKMEVLTILVCCIFSRPLLAFDFRWVDWWMFKSVSVCQSDTFGAKRM